MEKEETSIRVRVSQSLHSKFLFACKMNDQTASQLIRAFMRDYIKENGLQVSDKPSSAKIESQ